MSIFSCTKNRVRSIVDPTRGFVLLIWLVSKSNFVGVYTYNRRFKGQPSTQKTGNLVSAQDFSRNVGIWSEYCRLIFRSLTLYFYVPDLITIDRRTHTNPQFFMYKELDLFSRLTKLLCLLHSRCEEGRAILFDPVVSPIVRDRVVLPPNLCDKLLTKRPTPYLPLSCLTSLTNKSYKLRPVSSIHQRPHAHQTPKPSHWSTIPCLRA